MANRLRFSVPVLTSIKLESVEQQLLNIYGIPLGDAARFGIQARIEQELETRAGEIPAELIEQFRAAWDRFKKDTRMKVGGVCLGE